MFVLPKGLLKDIEQLIRRFLWSGDIVNSYGSKVAWDRVCLPKKEGGLGIKPLVGLNSVQNLNHIWNLLSPTNGSHLKHCDGHHGGSSLKDDDPLQVPDGPITRSRAKKIKEAMQGLVQSTWAEFASVSSKTPTFNMGLKGEEPTLTHLIQAT